MDVVTLAQAKKFALQVSAGFSSVSVNEDTSTITFTLNDGRTVNLTIPTPQTGVTVTSITIDENYHLIFTLSNGTVLDSGAIPKANADISAKEGNLIIKEDDGLYVPSAKEQEEDILDIISENIETTNIDFTDF